MRPDADRAMIFSVRVVRILRPFRAFTRGSVYPMPYLLIWVQSPDRDRAPVVREDDLGRVGGVPPRLVFGKGLSGVTTKEALSGSRPGRVSAHSASNEVNVLHAGRTEQGFSAQPS